MRKQVITLFLFVVSLLGLRAEVLTGKVVHISDGDTITVIDHTRTSYKIRLYGIDAPESKQPFGNVSKKHLGGLLGGGTVRVEWKSKDKYGRIVGTIFVGDLNVNLKMLYDGMAWHFKKYDHSKAFEDAKATAADRITNSESTFFFICKFRGLASSPFGVHSYWYTVGNIIS